MNARVLVLLAFVLNVLVLPAPPAESAQDCAAKVLATCTSCHYQARICEKLGKKNERDWKVTVKRMVRYGLALDEAAQEGIITCLLALKDDRTKLCR